MNAAFHAPTITIRAAVWAVALNLAVQTDDHATIMEHWFVWLNKEEL